MRGIKHLLQLNASISSQLTYYIPFNLPNFFFMSKFKLFFVLFPIRKRNGRILGRKENNFIFNAAGDYWFLRVETGDDIPASLTH